MNRTELSTRQVSPHARRPRRRPGENRERLLEAGIIEFGTRGYRGASTAAIAAAADVPQPHVYTSFENKRALFLACAERALVRLEQGSGDAFLLQAIAAAHEEELSDELLPLLRALRHRSGDAEFAAAIARAAAAALA